MKELLQEYKKTLKLTRAELRSIENDSFKYNDADAYYEVLKASEKDLQFAIAWIEKGFQPDAHYRGVQRNDAYYVMRPYDPSIIERYIENLQANESYELIDKDFANHYEKREHERIMFEENTPNETLELLERAKSTLRSSELDLLKLLQQGKSQSEIAGLIGVSQQAVSKRCKAIKKKLLKLGIERSDL